MTVPGSGFVEKENEFHFRITNLVCPTERMKETLDRLSVFNTKFYAKYPWSRHLLAIWYTLNYKILIFGLLKFRIN